MKKKTIALILACVLVLGCAITGTIAWLTDTTSTVTNTFTYSDINITLKETATEGGNETANSYQMIPGATIVKDPEVTVLADSVACWLFVKLEKSGNYDTFLENYVMADGWTEVETGVYSRQVSYDKDNAQKFAVIKENKLTVKESVTKADMEDIKDSGMPTLKITAYAIQQHGFDTAAAAWTQINTPNP